MTSQTGLHAMSSYSLVRMLMTKLWRIYDSGGVSVGRSLRAGLLESTTNLLSHVQEDAGIDIDTVETWDLRDEVFRRVQHGLIDTAQPVLFLSLAHIPDWNFACLVFEALLAWYEQDAKAHPWPLTAESEIARAIWQCMAGAQHVQQFRDARITFDPRSLIAESDTRFRERMKREIGPT